MRDGSILCCFVLLKRCEVKQFMLLCNWKTVCIADVLLSMFLKRKVVIQSDYCSKWNWHIGSTWIFIALKIQNYDHAVSKNLQHKISFAI